MQTADAKAMTADVELLPLPKGRWLYGEAFSGMQMTDYATANMAHANAAKGTEIEALRAEAERQAACIRANAGAERELVTARREIDRLEVRVGELEEVLRDLLYGTGSAVNARIRAKAALPDHSGPDTREARG